MLHIGLKRPRSKPACTSTIHTANKNRQPSHGLMDETNGRTKGPMSNTPLPCPTPEINLNNQRRNRYLLHNGLTRSRSETCLGIHRFPPDPAGSGNRGMDQGMTTPAPITLHPRPDSFSFRTDPFLGPLPHLLSDPFSAPICSTPTAEKNH